MIDVDLRTFIKDLELLPDVIGSVQQSKIDQEAPDTYIWIQRRTNERETLISGERGLSTTSFDVECVSDDMDACQQLATDIKDALDAYRGPMGDSFCDGCFAEDHSDEYEPRNASDDGIYVASLDLTIIHS